MSLPRRHEESEKLLILFWITISQNKNMLPRQAPQTIGEYINLLNTFKQHKIYRRFNIEPDIKAQVIRIPLFARGGRHVGYSYASMDKLELLCQYKFHRRVVKQEHRTVYYVISNFGKSMHELVMGGKAPRGYNIDHINRNTCDNVSNNLRFATFSQNAQNKGKKPKCTSEYIGVSMAESGRWKSYIKMGGKYVYLGTFDNEYHAAKIRDVYAIYEYGQSAMINDTLTVGEIIDILENGIPERYVRVVKKKGTGVTCSGGIYTIQIQKAGKILKGTAITEFEANMMADEFRRQHEQDAALKEAERIKHPTRNKDGDYVIYATYKKKKFEILVDEHVWPHVSRFHWCISPKGYCLAVIEGRATSLHRYIYRKYKGEIPENMTVDHILSAETHNNKLINLRVADKGLQKHNQNKSSLSLDKYTGTNYMKGKFHTFVDHKSHGSYDFAEYAALHANIIFARRYGKDARLNIIDWSVRTTKDNRIPIDRITKSFVENIKLLKDLKNVIMILRLNPRNKGSLPAYNIKHCDIETAKERLIKIIFLQDASPEDGINPIFRIPIVPESSIRHPNLSYDIPDEVMANIWRMDIEIFGRNVAKVDKQCILNLLEVAKSGPGNIIRFGRATLPQSVDWISALSNAVFK